MPTIKPSNKLKKTLKKLSHFPKKLQDLSVVLNLLKSGKTLPKKYKSHKLKGKKDIIFELHIQPDFLLTYFPHKERDIIWLQDIGSHSEIFE